jgi:tetratricopeptide (TPR) repeat protein
MHGALHLQLAVAAARRNDADAAYGYLETARQAGERLGADRNDYNTEFGPTNVLLHEAVVAVELGDAGRALRVADQVDTARLSPERQARLLIDVAQAHAQLRQPEAVVAALREAMRIAPEQIESHSRVRELVAELLRGDRRGSSEVKELASRLKVAS